MKRTMTALCLGAMMVWGLGSAEAAAPKIEEAAKTFGGIEGNAARLKDFCEMFKTMTAAEAEQDEKKAQAMEAEIDAKMKVLGDDFTNAWDLQAEIDAESEDGKAYYAAADKLCAFAAR